MRRLLALLAITCVARGALADPTKGTCVDADTNGQTLRMHGKLREARDAFRVCTNPSCPSVVRSDCATRIEEITRAMPTIVADTKGPNGDVAATMTIDGVATNAPTGEAVEVDPGEHRFVFEAAGFDAITRAIVIHEGEKARSIAVTFGVSATAPIAAPASTTSPLRVTGIVVGVVGLVGLGLGAGFGGASFSAWSSVKSECTTTSCDYAKATADRGHALDFATASDAAFIVGAVLAAAGITLFVLAPRTSNERAARVTPLVGPGSLGLALGGRF